MVDFLRNTDQALLGRIARRLLNYLSWNGIADAQQVLEQLSVRPAPAHDEGENLPLPQASPVEPLTLADRAFTIAGDHLEASAILGRLEGWIKEDRVGFLIDTVEQPGIPTGSQQPAESAPVPVTPPAEPPAGLEGPSIPAPEPTPPTEGPTGR